MSTASEIVVVVGNPKAGSRTAHAGEAVARVLAARAGGGPEPTIAIVELADLAPDLFDRSAPAVAQAVERALAAGVVILASPTFKATYTGLLKAFLDRIGGGAFRGTPVVPVMLAASPLHGLAVETHLRPLVAELGGGCPPRGVFLVEDDVEDDAALAEALDSWAEAQGPWFASVRASLESRGA